MPAYFSVDFRFLRTSLRNDFAEEFYLRLGEAGFPFQSGCYEAEAMRFEEIIRFNQRRLDENFELGFQENGSNDYKQVRFKRPEYQEVRGFWVNMAEEGEIGFCLIVPESDMIRTKTRGWYFRKGQLEPIIRMAAAMWDFEGMAAIQTGLELDDTVTLEELEAGKEPCIRPFAILPPKFMKSEYLKKYRIFHINRNGILILEELEQPGYTCGES